MQYSSNPPMHLPILIKATISLCKFFCMSFLINGVATAAQDSKNVVGAIIDVNTRIGREEKISMEIAVEAFNNVSSNMNNLSLRVIDSGGKPLQALMEANDLIKEKQVQIIVGMETWQEAVLVAEVANSAQVPILSYATPSITLPPLTSVRWPFLVRMANNDAVQMQCVASIVGSYGWRRVIAIYEDDAYSTDSGILAFLSDALQDVGSEIDERLAFPPFSTLSDPKTSIQNEFRKLNNTQSRVFIIVRCSLELASYILTEAKYTGLMGKDSVWITTDSVTNLLHTVNSSIMSSMQGVIGIKTLFSDVSPSFLSFSTHFRNIFRSVYPDEDKSGPGYHALRAYDTISTVALALEKSTNKSSTTVSRTLLANILSSNFNGLTGRIKFKNGELFRSKAYAIVNVIGQSYITLKFWSSEYGFSDNFIEETSTQERNKSWGGGGILGVPVYWPGKLDRVPLGWVVPSEAKPMIIGVPGRATFEKFVKVEEGKDPTGFCIDVFDHALKLLNYDLPHKFVPFYGLYDEMVDQVYFKNFDAMVGDITILANRSNYVEFTQPYAESGITMVVPVKSEEKAWLFVKPFTTTLWMVVSIIFVYTMFVVWFLEHRSNPDFRGPVKSQLSTAMWFTFSTLFFAHKENPRNNFTRIVIFVWLFTVFVVTSSYTASLTSMLTVRRLEPTVTDIETLRRTNSHVGCAANSFVRKYMEQVLNFHPNNIINIRTQYDYPNAFKNGTIAAAILELPYERVFLSENSKDYQDTGIKHRLGGLGFIFPKGSPMARDFSEAFLNLSEDGTLNRLDQYWFPSSSQRKNNEEDTENQRLSLSNFWGLFLVTGITSTVMLILYIVPLYTRFRHCPDTSIDTDDSVWAGIKRLGTYYDKGRLHHSHRDLFSTHTKEAEVLMSSDVESLSEYNTPTHPQPTSARGTEMPETYIGVSDNQPRVIRLSTFPGPGRRAHGFNCVDSEWQDIPRSTRSKGPNSIRIRIDPNSKRKGVPL